MSFDTVEVMKKETNISKLILLALSKIPGVRLFRNNVGNAWIGKSAVMTTRRQIWVNPGDVIIENGRFFHAGLCVGSSDLIGFKSETITPEMVGRKIAIFTAAEIKTETGRVSKEQTTFINMVNQFGGIGFVAKNEEEAINFLNHEN